MATLADSRPAAVTFEQKMSIGMAVFILFGFGQFAARGFVDYAAVPVIFHVHGALMAGWLILLITQASLAGRGSLALHRQLGWLSVLMVPAIMAVASQTCFTAIRLGLTPPFFSGPYFLALVHVNVIIFGLMIATALLRRKETAWHQRLMLGSTVLLLEPALGRILPMPLIMPWGEWLTMVIQLGVVFLMARNDTRTLGQLHPATRWVALCVVAGHVVVELLSVTPAWVSLTEKLTGA